MARAGIDFRPRFECGSMLQVRQLVAQESCAAVLPGPALAGLDERRILVAPFAPLAHYGRTLALHWNPRQMEMRGVTAAALRKAAACLATVE
jgi:DNA-binding transcriptional LysR family regulator